MASPKVKKRYGTRRNPDRDIAEAPDQVEEGLVGLWEWVRKYRFVIVGAMGGLAAVALIGQFVTENMRQGRMDEAKAFNDAVSVYSFPVVEPKEGEDPPELPKGVRSFETDKAKYEAVVADLSQVASAHEGDDLGKLAVAAQGGAKYQLGDYAGAAKVASDYLSGSPEGPLAPAFKQLLASSKAAEGDAAGAAGALGGAGSDWWNAGWSALVEGDLHAKGSPDKAKSSFQKGLAAFEGVDSELPAAKFLQNELQRRLDELQ